MLYIRRVIFLSLFFLSSAQGAAILGRPIIRGKVVSFNQRYIVMDTRTQGKMRVNRALTSSIVQLREGQHLEVNPNRKQKTP